MTRESHINQCRPSPAKAGNAIGVVGGSMVRFLGKDYRLRHTAGRLKLHFSLPLRGGLGCLEATHFCKDLFLSLELCRCILHLRIIVFDIARKIQQNGMGNVFFLLCVFLFFLNQW